MVYGTQNGPFFSLDGGQTVQKSQYNIAAPPPNSTITPIGDPSVAIGASSKQTFYFTEAEQASGTSVNKINAVGLYHSADGKTFDLTSFPVNCANPTNDPNTDCVNPDQPQLAADRMNQVPQLSGGPLDELYLAWRNIAGTAANSHIDVACSRDGGITWNVDKSTFRNGAADFPRLGVAPNGDLLVAYAAYNDDTLTTYTLKVKRFESCARGFSLITSGQVAPVHEVSGMPGLDRPALANYSLAFDDEDRFGSTIFIVFANEASAGNDDIHVSESRDGGATWNNDAIVNTASAGHRYFPWICSSHGAKFVTWYDRRNDMPDATGKSPGLTAYFRSSVFDDGTLGTAGTPGTVGVVKPDINVSGVDDAQCASGFPAAFDALPSDMPVGLEEGQCSSLPAGFILGGRCQPSGFFCDFRKGCADPSDQCTPLGGAIGGFGAPKYGDYNGAACAQGALFMAWASATPPPGACLVNGISCNSPSHCCSGNCVGGACAPTAAACTPNGGSCLQDQDCCGSNGANGGCEARTCVPAVTMYTDSTVLQTRKVTVCGTIEVDNQGTRAKESHTSTFFLSPTNLTGFDSQETQVIGGCKSPPFGKPFAQVGGSIDISASLNLDNSVSVNLHDRLAACDAGLFCAFACGFDTTPIQDHTADLKMILPGQGQLFDDHLQNSDNDVFADYHFIAFNDCEGCSTTIPCPQ